jgi:hypothetical protein
VFVAAFAGAPVKQNKSPIGFPVLNDHEEDVATRPMGLHEIPPEARVEREMAVVNRHHERIARAIKLLWGHQDCADYIQKLIMSGGDGDGKARLGFKAEVLTALINLTELHEVTQR